MPIAYLDTPSGISGDIFLACLVDAGWPLASLRQTVEKLDLPKGSWDIQAQSVTQGSIRGTRVQVEAADEVAERHLAEITEILEAAALPDQVTRRARAVFARLAAAEAKIHGTTPDEVHFHEVGALDAIIDIV